MKGHVCNLYSASHDGMMTSQRSLPRRAHGRLSLIGCSLFANENLEFAATDTENQGTARGGNRDCLHCVGGGQMPDIDSAITFSISPRIVFALDAFPRHLVSVLPGAVSNCATGPLSKCSQQAPRSQRPSLWRLSPASRRHYLGGAHVHEARLRRGAGGVCA